MSYYFGCRAYLFYPWWRMLESYKLKIITFPNEYHTIWWLHCVSNSDTECMFNSLFTIWHWWLIICGSITFKERDVAPWWERSFMVDPLSYFSFQPVINDWCNKGRGLCYTVCGMMYIKEPLLLNGKSSLCGGSGFSLSLSDWSCTIYLKPYNRNKMCWVRR